MWWSGPSCQRMQAASPTQKMPFLPKRRAHDRQLPRQSPAVATGLSGNVRGSHGGESGAQSLPSTHRLSKPIRSLYWKNKRIMLLLELPQVCEKNVTFFNGLTLRNRAALRNFSLWCISYLISHYSAKGVNSKQTSYSYRLIHFECFLYFLMLL